MENKYFTPSIEDIRVGYECEVLSEIRTEENELAATEWIPHIINNRNHTVRCGKESIVLNNTIMFHPMDKIRVPYLTKQQIEAEGWQRLSTSRMIKGESALDLLESNTIVISNNGSVCFCGDCKDINTFRYICKLLGI